MTRAIDLTALLLATAGAAFFAVLLYVDTFLFPASPAELIAAHGSIIAAICMWLRIHNP